jgi:hypothetical protein
MEGPRQPKIVAEALNKGAVMADIHVGLDEMMKYPLFEALHKRRSRRISLGIPSIPAGSNSYSSTAKPQPLSEL